MAKINDTKEALAVAGLVSFNVSGKVQGRGRGKGFGPKYQEIINTPELKETLQELEEPRLKTKRMISVVVTDDKLETAIQAIISSNKTGNSGDGKIFVTAVPEALQIRTGNTGDQVLD
jgi:nitrogen regulatory protein PII 2